MESSDCLCEFYHHLWPLEPSSDKSAWLFPDGLLVQAWRHLVDSCLRRASSSLPWFPSFLRQLDSRFEFLAQRRVQKRNRSRNFRHLQIGVERVCRALNALVEPVISKFDPKPFKANRDTKAFGLGLSAFRDGRWLAKFRWIGDLSSLQAWVGGCDCHEEEING